MSTDESLRYARAQARWLAREFPHARVRVVDVVRVEFVYEEGHAYSSVTYEDGSFDVFIHYNDGDKTWIDVREKPIDITRMVVEGLALLEGEQ